MNKKNYPLLENFCLLFKHFAQLGVHVAETVLHFAHFQVQAKKEVSWGGVGGVLCTYISQKGVCDCSVKNRGWWWYSGQNETPSGQNEIHLGNLYKKSGQKCLRIGRKKSINSAKSAFG